MDWDGVIPEHLFDEERAAELVGKTIAVTITRTDGLGAKLEGDAYHGTVVSVSREGFRIVEEAPRKGAIRVIPPGVDLVREAEPGVYRLEPGGVIVEHPDLIVQLEISDGPVN